MSRRQLRSERLRIRASDIDPLPTPGFSTFGLFELCPQPDSPYPLGLPGSRLSLEEATEPGASESSDDIYVRLGAITGVVSDSEPHDRDGPTGVLVVLVDNLDPARDEDFNRWYDEVHVPDILSAGSFYRATRYGAAGPSPRAAYLAVYETDWQDPEAAFEAMTARPNPAGLWDAIAPIHLALYRRL